MSSDDLIELAERVQAAYLWRGLTVAAAESCTGGLVTDTLTDVPGSSGYLLGGVVAYADRAKEAALGVPSDILVRHGAVSAQVARAMALGARERFGASVGVATTGIAGPGGATAGKPVGLTYVAVAGPAADGLEVRRFLWTGDRLANKRDSAREALRLLLAAATGAEGEPISGSGAAS